MCGRSGGGATGAGSSRSGIARSKYIPGLSIGEGEFKSRGHLVIPRRAAAQEQGTRCKVPMGFQLGGEGARDAHTRKYLAK